MKYEILLSLLMLAGCDWFGGGNSSYTPPKAVYTADWELDNHDPLVACDGTILVYYHIIKCYKDGVETNINDCSGLIKLPEQVKSPVGIQVEDIKNYKDEIIGERTYNCEEGDLRKVEASTVTCSDSRYIKQSEDGVEDCFAYFKQLKPMPISSEDKLYLTNNDPYLYNPYSTVFPLMGLDVKKVFKNNEGRVVQLSNNNIIVFEYPNHRIPKWAFGGGGQNEIKTKNNYGTCLMFIDNNSFCPEWNHDFSSNPYNQGLLADVKDFYFINSQCWQNNDGKFFCASGYTSDLGLGTSNTYFNVVTEIPLLENMTKFFSLNYMHYPKYCFNKNNKGYCFKLNDGAELVSDKEMIDISYNPDLDALCFVDIDFNLFCRGSSLSVFFGLEISNSSFTFVKEQVKEIIIDMPIVSYLKSNNEFVSGSVESPSVLNLIPVGKFKGEYHLWNQNFSPYFP